MSAVFIDVALGKSRNLLNSLDTDQADGWCVLIACSEVLCFINLLWLGFWAVLGLDALTVDIATHLKLWVALVKGVVDARTAYML